MSQNGQPNLLELWQVFLHTKHAADLIEYIQAGGEITEDVRLAIIECLSQIDYGKRNPHLKQNVIEDIEWELAINRNANIDTGTPLNSMDEIFRAVSENRGMTIAAVKKIWQRKPPRPKTDVDF
jgi:hypothetical protein